MEKNLSLEDFLQNDYSFPEEKSLFELDLYKNAKKAIDKSYLELTKNNDKFVYRPYQAKYAAMALLRKRNYLAHDMGVGKTLEGSLVLHALYKNVIETFRPGVIHIIAPVNIILGRWIADLSALGFEKYIDIIDSEADISKSKKPIWLYTYRFLTRESRNSLDNKKNGNKYRTKFIKDKEELWFQPTYLYKIIKQKNRKPKFIIADEIHNCREDSLITKCLYELSKCAPRRLALSGTPVDGRIDHIEGALRLIYGTNSLLFPFAKNELGNMFKGTERNTTNYLNGEDNISADNNSVRPMLGVPVRAMPRYSKLINKLVHRLTEDNPEVKEFAKFPLANIYSINLTLNEKQQQDYNKLFLQSTQSLNQSKASFRLTRQKQEALLLIHKLKEASSCPWSFDPSYNETSKITGKEGIIDIVKKSLLEKRKVIIFTAMSAAGGKIKKAIEKHTKAKVLRLYSSDKFSSVINQKMDEREEVMNSFSNNEADVMVCQYAIASEGVDFTNASVVILHDLPMRSVFVQQAVKRCIRPGQTHPYVDVYWLKHANTIDVYFEKLIVKKILANKRSIDFDFNHEVFKKTCLEDSYELKDMLDELLNN
jgi:superfamily II DNA or RNA helicase